MCSGNGINRKKLTLFKTKRTLPCLSLLKDLSMIEIRREADDCYRFNLKNASGRTILRSVAFENKDEVARTVAELLPLVKKNTGFERKTNYEGKFLFSIKNTKGQVIGQSSLFASEAGMENGIETVKNRIVSISKANDNLQFP
jgi:uncharacterized protein YegP (UPF0339 family)